MTRLAAVVTTFNNAANLSKCLEILRFCDEIIVLDSDSSDETRDIAAQYSAKIFVEPFKGYGPQKQSAIDKANSDWVLLLDADEHVIAINNNPEAAIFKSCNLGIVGDWAQVVPALTRVLSIARGANRD